MSDRIRLLTVHPQFLVDLCKGGEPRAVVVVANPLPDDATFVRSGVDPFGQVSLVVQSSKFDDVPDGEPIPLHPAPQFRMVS